MCRSSQIHLCLKRFMSINIHVCKYIDHIYEKTYVSKYINIYTYMYIHITIYIDMYIHIYEVSIIADPPIN